MSGWLVCCPAYWGVGCIVELGGAGVRGSSEVMPVKCTPK